MTKHTDQSRYLVPGLVRGIEVLRLFTHERTLVSTTEMASELAIPRSTVFRLVHTLEHLDLITQDPPTGSYRLALGMMALGLEYLSNQELPDVCQPDLEELRDVTGCSTHLAVAHEHNAVIMMKIAGRSAYAGSLNVGTRLPIHATALGRCLLLDCDDVQVRELLGEREFGIYTDQTPQDIAALCTLLQRDRHEQCVVSQSFFERGISSIAAPVRDDTGGICAAISITIYGDSAVDPGNVDLVKRCAQQLSVRLNYKGDTCAVAVSS